MRNLLFLLLVLALTSCTALPSPTPTQSQADTPVAIISSTTEISSIPSPSSTYTDSPKLTSTGSPAFIIQPDIHKQPGDIYNIVFSIPVGERNIVKYNIPSCCGEIEGPKALAVLPDSSFMIVDFVGNRLLRYDVSGMLLEAIELNDLGIKTVIDLRVKNHMLFLLEIGYRNYVVHQLSLEGKLITSENIPHDYPIGKDAAIENVLTGFGIDCDGNILLEAYADLYHLTDVQTGVDIRDVTQGYHCNGKQYLIINPGIRIAPNLLAGDIVYDTSWSTGLVSFRFLDVFQDGTIYVYREDVVDESPPIKVDQTLHYLGPDGLEQGVARVPISEFYYYIMRNAAIAPSGEVYVMLPRANSFDIVRLNFYLELEPLIPGAVVPHINRK